jgi:class 3 adenylate cyclase
MIFLKLIGKTCSGSRISLVLSKLTAILSADVEGYSRFMREDEDATVKK